MKDLCLRLLRFLIGNSKRHNHLFSIVFTSTRSCSLSSFIYFFFSTFLCLYSSYLNLFHFILNVHHYCCLLESCVYIYIYIYFFFIQIFAMNVIIAATESMTHDVTLDSLGLKLDMTKYIVSS